MRAVVTRVRSASVSIDGAERASIQRGFLVLLGVRQDDTEKEAAKIADRIAGLRVFSDEQGKMNLNLRQVGLSEILLISQFTLFADCRQRRPGFTLAARPATAIPLYEKVISLLREQGFTVETGEFGADMLVASENDGPVTILLDTDEL